MSLLNTTATELPWLWAGLAAYGVATVAALGSLITLPRHAGVSATPVQPRYEMPVLWGLVIGVVLLTMALAERWVRIGHGPFVNLFELLMSQLFSLGLVYALAYWRVPVLRPTAVVVLPAMWVLGVWVLLLDPAAVPFPPTYHNPWLWAHVGTGKIFLSLSLIGTGLAGVILLRRWLPALSGAFRHMPGDEVIDALAWRFMLLALIFDSLMLIAGAVWAQDAWGRYWAWDPLETSAFLTWLLLGISLHARFTYRLPIQLGALAIIAVFVLAFVTYFGTPFYSEAAHKGVI